MPEEQYIHARRQLAFALVTSVFPDWKRHVAEAELLSGVFNARSAISDSVAARIERLRTKLDRLTDEQLDSICELHASSKAETFDDLDDLVPIPEVTSDQLERWAMCRLWSVEEMTAVLLGKDPRRVSWPLVKPLVGQSLFATRYADLRDLILRSVKARDLSENISPTMAIRWAKHHELGLPPHLEAMVVHFAEFASRLPSSRGTDLGSDIVSRASASGIRVDIAGVAATGNAGQLQVRCS